MTMSLSMAAIMRRSSVIPVLAIESLAHAIPLARALVAGGVSVLEVTLRTETALPAIEQIASAVPDVIVGVGTCTTAPQMKAAENAGAQFIVTPGLTETLIAAADKVSIPVLPGVSTASELMRAGEAGFGQLKFFPAESSGGVPALKAFAGPFPDVQFCPTGGVHPGNLGDYLALPNVLCVGGSWLAPADAVEAGDWARITALAAAVSDHDAA